ncbi:MAG: hypothetical protein D6713_10415, partial [Deltaproteobacteria bacterium]
ARWGIGVAASLLVLSFYILPSLSHIRSLKRKTLYYESVIEKLAPLSEKALLLKSEIERKTHHIPSRPFSTEEVRNIIGRVCTASGVPLEALEIKYSGTTKKGAFQESFYRIEAKELTFREVFTLIRSLEKDPAGIVIRESTIKPTFESPRYLELSLKISLISKLSSP